MRENPIVKVEHKRLEDAQEEYSYWERILIHMRTDPEFNDAMPYNRWDVIERKKELLEQIAVLKTAGLGREAITENRVHRIVELSFEDEFNQEEVYINGSRRRWEYR